MISSPYSSASESDLYIATNPHVNFKEYQS